MWICVFYKSNIQQPCWLPPVRVTSFNVSKLRFNEGGSWPGVKSRIQPSSQRLGVRNSVFRPGRSYGRRLRPGQASTGGERVGAGDKGRERSGAGAAWAAVTEAGAACLARPGRAVTAWLVMSEAPLGPGPGPETIFLMKIMTGQCRVCICTLHPHNEPHQ